MRGDEVWDTSGRSEEATRSEHDQEEQATRGRTWGSLDIESGHKERFDASQDIQDAWDAEYRLLASGPNTGGSDATSVFADGGVT